LTREIGKLNRQDPATVDLRADSLYALTMRDFEKPCAWTLDQAFEMLGATVCIS
jgi:hypothetical protein